MDKCLAESNKPRTSAKPTNKPVCTPVTPTPSVVQIGAAQQIAALTRSHFRQSE